MELQQGIPDKNIRDVVERNFNYESYGAELKLNGNFINLRNGVYVEIAL